jgi:uncharacterized membrane protein YeiH
VAILLGIKTAVGWGVVREVLLDRIPVILEKEIYASAAFIEVLIVALGHYFNWLSSDWVAIIGLVFCFTFLILALRFHRNLPVPSSEKIESDK